MRDDFGSWKRYDSGRYGWGDYTYLNEEVLCEALCNQAREELAYARGEMRRYRRTVNRKNVYRTDKADRHLWINSGLWALQAIARSFSATIQPVHRLAKVLERHCERLDRQFKALYEQDEARIQAVKDEAHAKRMAELLS